MPKFKMNPRRKKVLDEMFDAYNRHVNRPADKFGDLSELLEAQRLNQKFIGMSRGHGRKLPFIKSVAMQKNNSTSFPRHR